MEKIDIDKLLDEHKLMVSNEYFYFDNKRFCVETNNGFKQLDDVHKVKIYFDGGYMNYAIKFIYGNNLEFNLFLRQITNIKIEDMYKKLSLMVSMLNLKVMRHLIQNILQQVLII